MNVLLQITSFPLDPVHYTVDREMNTCMLAVGAFLQMEDSFSGKFNLTCLKLNILEDI